MIPRVRKQAGFSLIELAVILTIVGLLVASMMETYRGYIRTKVSNDTDYRKDIANQAIISFVINYNRLPCPADPALPMGAANAGVEQRDAVTKACIQTGSILRVDSERQTYANPAFNAASCMAPIPCTGTPRDKVMIGSLPYVTLGIGMKEAIDGWGNKFTYAMSEYMADETKFNYHIGAISIKKLNNSGCPGAPCGMLHETNQVKHQAADNETMLDNRTAAFPFVILSHGANGKGAYSSYGTQPVACNSSTGRDVENCDGDAVFFSADRSTSIYSLVHADPPGTDPTDPDGYFDDAFTVYTLTKTSDKWAYVTPTTMNNYTGGKVGIGLSLPQYPVHVEGNVKTNSILAEDICSLPDTSTAKPSYCFDPMNIAANEGDSRLIKCTGGMLTGIVGNTVTNNATETCASTVDTSTVGPLTCPSGQYVTGISAGGVIQCASP